MDARTGAWATDLLADLDVPRSTCSARSFDRALCSVRCRQARRARPRPSPQVVAPACHDTGSAFASVEAGGHTAFLSCGTWSLLGTEMPAAVITDRSRELNFTNEGGVNGTFRVLKNIGGLWLLQACRRDVGRARSSAGRTKNLVHGRRRRASRVSGPCSIPTIRRFSTHAT